jgi:hypothetical protein
MSILISEVHLRLSGGAANTDPNTSIGGNLSSFQISDAILNSMFDDISSAEALAGNINYRCFYVYNSNAFSPFNGVNVWMKQLPGGDATMSLGLDPGGLNSTPAVVINEATAPSGVTFSSAINVSTALYMGNIPPLGRFPIWIRRVQSGNASPTALVSPFSILIQGLTNT